MSDNAKNEDQVLVNGQLKNVSDLTTGDVIAESIFDAIDRAVAAHIAAHPEDAAKFDPPNYSSPVLGMLDPGHTKAMGPGGPKLPRDPAPGPNFMLPGGPRYPRELRGVNPFPEFARDGWSLTKEEANSVSIHDWCLPSGFGPRPDRAVVSPALIAYLTEPTAAELNDRSPWAGYAPDYFLGDRWSNGLLGKRLTLDMLYAPHPDPFQRIGKKGPPSPWPSGGHLWTQRHLTAFWGNWHIHEPNSDFYNIWQRNDNRFLPPPLPILVPIAPEDIKEWLSRSSYEFKQSSHFDQPLLIAGHDHGITTGLIRSLIQEERRHHPVAMVSLADKVSVVQEGLADVVASLNFDIMQRFTDFFNEPTNFLPNVTHVILERIVFVGYGIEGRYQKQIGSMRKKKARRHTAMKPVYKAYSTTYKDAYPIFVQERGEVPDVGAWELTPQQLPSTTEQCTDVLEVNVSELTELFDHGNGVKTYGVLTGPYGELPQYPKLTDPAEPPFPPPYKVIPKGENE